MIEELKLLLAKEKAIFTNMNLLNISNNVFYGYAWLAAEHGNIYVSLHPANQLFNAKKTKLKPESTH